MKYQYITIQDIPQALETILDPDSPVNKAMSKERKAAENGLNFELVLREINELIASKRTSPNLMLELIENRVSKALKLLK